MERERVTEAKIRGRWLEFLDLSGSKKRLQLPFGHGLRLNEHVIYLERIGGRHNTLLAVQKRHHLTPTCLSPTFSRSNVISHPLTGAKVRMQFRLALSDLERSQALQVIEREHYLIAPVRGMQLICSFTDKKDEKTIRKWGFDRLRKASREIDPAVEYKKPGQVVGVAVLDTLYHGNPKDGRSEFANNVLRTTKWREWPRNKIVQKLRLSWGSRFAIDAPFQGLGIGTLLAKQLKTVARHYRMPAADFLEVITTEPKDRGARDHNFLLQAGYHLSSKPMKSGRLRQLNFKTGDYDEISAVKRYYFVDLRHEKSGI